MNTITGAITNTVVIAITDTLGRCRPPIGIRPHAFSVDMQRDPRLAAVANRPAEVCPREFHAYR